MASTTRSERQTRSILRDRIEARRTEFEQELLGRVLAVPDPSRAMDPDYLEMLRIAVSAALGYGLDTIVAEELGDHPLPVALLAQARLAARNDVSLDTVLRRYFAGYAVLDSILVEEAGRDHLMGRSELRRLVDAQSRHFERLLTGVSEEYAREMESLLSSTGHRRARLVRALLDEEPVDRTELSYEFDAWHLAAIAVGMDAADHLRGMADGRNHRLLLVSTSDETAWAWFGGRRRPDPASFADMLVPTAEGLTVALGEPAQGLGGWRLTHRQAMLALPVAMRLGRVLVRYVEVGLVASVLRDETLARSLHHLYLEPWSQERDSEELHRTLRAYFAAEQNVSSAAAALGVKRHTVTNRLRRVEERLGRRLGDCSVELATALRLEEVADLANDEQVGRPPWPYG